MKKTKWAVVTDFDGTVTTFDIGDAICMYFRVVTREEIEQSYDLGIPVERWMRQMFLKLTADLKEIEKFVLARAKVRPGFAKLVHYCVENGIPCQIASGGLDEYIRPVLKKWKVRDLDIFCGRLYKDGKLDPHYPMSKKGFSVDKLKASRVKYFKDRGFKVIFCGDGVSDCLAAQKADVIFADGRLLKFCRQKKLNVHKLADFNKILKLIKG